MEKYVNVSRYTNVACFKIVVPAVSYERYSISWQVLIQTFQRIKTWRVDRCKIVSQLKHNYHRSQATGKFHQGESNLGDRCKTNDIPDRCVFVASAQSISRITCKLYRAKKRRWTVETRSMESVKHRYTARSSILPHDFCMYLLPRFFAGNKTEDSSRVEFANRVTSSAFLCFTLAKIVYCWRNVSPGTFCSPPSWPNRRNYFTYSGQSRKCIAQVATTRGESGTILSIVEIVPGDIIIEFIISVY